MSFLGQVLPSSDADVRVADRVEITDLMLRYMSAYDFGDVETFEASFSDPLIWDLTQTPACFTGGAADWEPTEFSRAEFVAKAGPPPPAADAGSGLGRAAAMPATGRPGVNHQFITVGGTGL